eukprot:TRINITY_DN69577_c0_g1_i1.p1 TRINITY_DN69577_c0_g1~~TRINITY_DN69577_c0_g1_i1.p1  ORF type:complete len:271 (-),score=53.25 TRINITY_DN69577_c0_g1_i1:178-969(-)
MVKTPVASGCDASSLLGEEAPQASLNQVSLDANTPALQQLDDLRQLSVADLKRRLSEHRIPLPLGCLEKADLVATLAERLGRFAEVSPEAFEANLAHRGPSTPVIFLDVDGVLNGRRTYDPVRRRLEEDCMLLFTAFARETEASVVLSTTWRHEPHLRHELVNALWQHGLPRDSVVGQTPNLGFDRREEEIQNWLMTAGAEVRRFVVLDDLPLKAAELGGRFVQTNPDIGLTEDDIEQARKVLEFQSGWPLQLETRGSGEQNH